MPADGSGYLPLNHAGIYAETILQALGFHLRGYYPRPHKQKNATIICFFFCDEPLICREYWQFLYDTVLRAQTDRPSTHPKILIL